MQPTEIQGNAPLAMATVCSHESFVIEHFVSALLGTRYCSNKSCNKFYSEKSPKLSSSASSNRDPFRPSRPRLYWLPNGGIWQPLGVGSPEAHVARSSDTHFCVLRKRSHWLYFRMDKERKEKNNWQQFFISSSSIPNLK